SGRQRHIVTDVLSLEKEPFDTVIAFPPCTYLCKAQFGLLSKSKERRLLMHNAVQFVDRLFNFSSRRIMIENPIGILNNGWKKPSQIIRPDHFGDPYKKDVCLWLKGLPPLIATCFNPVRKN